MKYLKYLAFGLCFLALPLAMLRTLWALPVILAAIAIMGVMIYKLFKEDAALRKQKIKMYCIVSEEVLKKMNGSRGKMLNQAGHAYLHAFWDSMDRFPHLADAYRSAQAFKIVCVVPTEADLRVLEAKYKSICGVSLVEDAGYTVFKNPDGSPRPTITFLGIGPIPQSLIEDDLGKLPTLT